MNCEEYVVNKLIEAERVLDIKNAEIRLLKGEILREQKRYNELIDFLKKKAKASTSEQYGDYYNMYVWRQDEEEDFEFIERLLGGHKKPAGKEV